MAYRGQVAGTYQILRLPAGNQSVAHRGEILAVHTISQLQGMGIADIQSPVTVSVTVQRLNTGRHLQRWRTAPIFYDAYGKSKYQLHD